MCDRRFRLGWLVGFVVLAALPRAGDARITFVQEEGIDADGHFEYEIIGDIVVSPDDAYVYTTTGYTPTQIVVYARAPETGAVDELAVVDPASRDVEILALSPDGVHLYGLDYVTGAVVAFARNSTTGLITRL